MDLVPSNFFGGKRGYLTVTHKYQVKTTQLKEKKQQQHELVDIVNITLSSNVIGL